MADTSPPSSSFDPFAGPAILGTAPTTEPQREIWTACALGDDASRAFNESLTLTLKGPLNREALVAAFDDVIARHDALSSTLSSDGLTLVVGPPAVSSLAFMDWSSLDGEAQQREQAALREREVNTAFDLVHGPLYRAYLVKLSDEEHFVCLTAHHAVFDGYSNGVLIADWGALYAQRLGLSGAPERPPSFAEYARRSAAIPPELSSPDEAYWLKLFSGAPTSVDLPTDRMRPPLKTYASRREDLHLEPALVAALRRTGASYKASLFATLFAGFNVVVNRLSQQEDLVVGIPSAGQTTDEAYSNLVGHLVNMLPIRTTVLRSEPFNELLARVRSALLDAQEHQSFGFGKLLMKLPLPRDPSRLPLVSVIFNVDRNAANGNGTFAGLTTRVAGNPRAFENFDLFINAVEVEGRVELECQYNTDLFDASTIRRWLGTYETLLKSITQDPTKAVGALDVVSDADVALMKQWNATEVPLPEAPCVHDLVAASAERSPDAVAVEFNGQGLTYAELDRKAEAFARKLRSLGVKRGTLVGLCVERSPLLLVGALAIWKAGGAYVPMDPGYPRERLAQMLEDSQAPVLVSEAAVQRELALAGATVAFVEEDPGDVSGVSLADERATTEDVAYVIYTSGSTGKPKGVLVPHRAVVNLLASVAKVPGVTANDVVLAVTTLSFDIAVSETWLPLVQGARIVLVSRDVASDGGLLRDVIESRGVTFIDATPATYRLLLGAGWQGSSSLKLICTGEAMPLDLAGELLCRSGSLWNGYGPTETTVWSTFWQVPPGLSRVLIGKPVDNTFIYLLDEQRRPVPVNVPGEIYIGGTGVTHGYLNRPEMTAERFVDDPFAPGKRMYRTGDLGRYLPSGDIECMGRNDNQVKLRGFRIELGEIETALGQHEALTQVAVIKREDRPGDAKLVAYFVSSGEPPSVSDLRAHLKKTLPDYMVPAAFVNLTRMPLTPSGKIDRRALPAPEAGAARSEGEFVAPTTPMEKTMAELWAAMLGVGRVSIHDDFFALGGHSLLASQILARLRRDHGVQLSFRKFFEAPTVARLAKEAEAAGGDLTAAPPPIARRPEGATVPLSIAQERIALMEQMHPAQQATHTLPAAWQIAGKVDLGLMQEALDVIVARHETLRTTVKIDGSRMAQDIKPSLKLAIELRDLRSLPEAERRPAMMAEIRKATQTPFDLTTGPLFLSKLYQLEDELFIYFTLRHNLIWDGWSYDVFLSDLCETYASLVQKRPSKLPELPVRYGDYVLWHREWLKSTEIARQRDWWHKELADSPPDLELPYDHARPQRMRYEGGTIIARFSKEQSQALTALGHRGSTTLFMTLFAAYAVLLHRYTGRDDILVGLPVRGRQAPELENLIGSFTNTIVLRARFDENETFLDFLKKTRDRALDAFSHEQLPLEMLQIRPPVVRALFSFQDARTRPLKMDDMVLKQVDVEPPAAANDLMVWMVERHDHMVAVVNYSSELFERETVEAIVRGFSTLVDDVVAHPERKLSELLVVHEQDSRALAASSAPASDPESLESLLARQTSEAAVQQDGSSLSGAALQAQSSAVAAAIREAGLNDGAVVAIASTPSPAQVAALIGVWRAGASALVIDPRFPAALQRRLLETSQARLLLCAGPAPEGLAIATVDLAQAVSSGRSLDGGVSSRGATWLWPWLLADGKVELAPVRVSQLVSAAKAAAKSGLTPGGRLAVAANPLSETFALEVMLALVAGKALQLPTTDARADDALIDSLRASAPGDVAFAATNALAELRSSGAKLPETVLVAGGAGADLLEAWRKEAKRVTSLRVLPSRVFALLEETERSLHPGGLHGNLLGAGAAVLDQRGQQAPLGVTGELQVAGQRTDLRARRLASGSLDVAPAGPEWLSIGGQRFERGAIASVVAEHAAVAAVHVSIELAGTDGERIVGYVVPREGMSFTETELRRQARTSLPASLVPHAFVELAELPRDASGKLDAKRLPSPFAAPAAAYVAPRTDSEKQLARMFIEVLNVPRVGVHDNFFDLGGQSLLCLRVIDMIERETKARLSPRILLLNTLEQAASALDQLRGVAAAPAAAQPSKAAEPTGVAGRVIKGLRGLLGGGS